MALLELVTIKSGQVDPRATAYRNLPLIAPDHVESQTGRLLKKESAAAQGAISGKYLVQPGDVIYSKIRPYLQKAYKCDFDALCSADMYPFTPQPGVDASFILHSILGRDFTDFATSVSARSGIPKINREELSEYRMAVPSSAEQKAIGRALDNADDLIAALERVIAKKRAIKQGMMQQLPTGKTRLAGFTREWAGATLGDLEKVGKLKLFRGKVISKLDIAAHPGSYPIYSSSVHNHGLFGTYGRYMFDEELITWSVDGGGHFFYRPRHKFSVTNVCGYMRVMSKSIDPRFLAYQLQALHSRLHFDYTLKAHPSVIRGAYYLTLPQLGEQQAIATALSDVDAEIAALQARLTKTRDIKTGMMQQLLTGRTRLPVQEPAS